MEILIILVIIPLVAFWVYQFVFLLMLEDNFFPGKFDKLIWGAVFIFLWPFAPFVFLLWRGAILSRVKKTDQTDTHKSS
jgi:hypothetical protein